MAKKKKHPEHENLERWLVSYADFITLLFATFVALFAMSQQDIAKMKDAAKAIRQGFEEQSIIHGARTILNINSTAGQDSEAPVDNGGAGDGVLDFESLTYVPGDTRAEENQFQKTIQSLSDAANDIIEAVKKAWVGTEAPGIHQPTMGEAEEAPPQPVQVSFQERGLRVSFDSRLLFERGTATLRSESEEALDKIAKNLTDYNRTHIIHVEGHTDNEPISSALYPSNWELSAARASTVVRYLIKNHGFSKDSLVAVGYGDSQPLTSNLTPEGRAKNRRVDIIIYSRKASATVDPRKQYGTEERTLIRYEERDANNEVIQPILIRSESAPPSGALPPDGPANLIIQDESGNVEKVIIPKPVDVEPDIEPDLGTFEPDSVETEPGH